RYRKLSPRRQREKVDSLFQRQNPPVQQVARTDDLSTEVVDQEHAAIRLDVQRGGVEIARRVVPQIEHVEREFPGGDHDRPLQTAGPSSSKSSLWMINFPNARRSASGVQSVPATVCRRHCGA